MDKQFYIYLAIMSLITYAIRAIPLVFINKKITNPTIQSFLDYIPYTVLAAMTFPDIFYSTGHLISGIVATIIIIYASYKELSLIQVACIGCFVVVMIELILWYNVSHFIFYVFSTRILLLWRWFCLVSYSPVTPYLQGIHGFWKFVAVHQKSSFFRNLGSKLASNNLDVYFECRQRSWL